MNEIVFYVLEEDVGNRLDKFLSENLPDKTRSNIQKLIENDCVFCNGVCVSKNYKVRQNDCVCVQLPRPKTLDVAAQNIAIDIVYEDDDLLVVNKPKGMVVHPAAGNEDGTLVNALLHHCGESLSGINGVIRPGIVHRIDKDTSGLLVVAKNDTAHVGLAEQIKVHNFTREYEAVVHGIIKQDGATINAPIGRHPTDRKKMCVTDKNSKAAVTHFTVLERYKQFTHVRCNLETGRTHQIRVHMSHLGHPIAGDAVYGPKKAVNGLHGQCLHAKKLGFVHPISGVYLEFESTLPQEFTTFLQKIELW